MKQPTKKLRNILLACTVAIGIVPSINVPAYAETTITINATNFPDINFRNYIRETADQNPDGILHTWEMSAVTKIDVSKRAITNLKGIEYFTNLKELRCIENKLTTLDVSQNTALEMLYCGSNKLTTLDVSKNPSLKELGCGSNKLAALDVSSNPLLERLVCEQNQLTTLDVNSNTSLKYLNCYWNYQLTELKVSGAKVLEELYISDSPITTLDVSGNTALKVIYCYDTNITSLDVSKNTALEELNCPGNQLTELKVSGAASLKKLYCSDNQLSELNVRSNPSLEKLWCGRNQITILDIRKNQLLEALYCTDNQLTTLLAAGAEKLSTLYCENNKLSKLDLTQCPAVEYLMCQGNQLTSLKVGKMLKNISCEDNQITTLDVSGNEALEELTCYNNQLKTLNASGDKVLTVIDCQNNQLTTLDVTGNEKLGTLKCQKNQLTTLDVSELGNLAYLECQSNQLTALDVSKNPLLKTLDCQSNQLTALDVSGNEALSKLYCQKNHLSSLDVSKNTELKAENLECGENSYTITTHSMSLDDIRQFNLSSLPGSFDATKAGSWTGGTAEGNVLTINNGVNKVTYDYYCGGGKGENFSLEIEAAHTLTLVPAVEPTYTTMGNKAYYTCSTCEKWFEDEKGFVEVIDRNSVFIPAKERTKIAKVEATSEDMLPSFGAEIKGMTFTVTEGSPAYVNTAWGVWEKKSGDLWLPSYEDVFTKGTWRYRGSLYIDGKDADTYELTSPLTFTVNGEEWLKDYTAVLVKNTYSCANFYSPEYEIETPEGMELTFLDSDSLDITYIYVNEAIYTKSLKEYAGGGTGSYTFSKTSGPDWITVSADGNISGTPTVVGPNEELTVRVTDETGAYKEIVIFVDKTNMDPADREEVAEVEITSENICPAIGAMVAPPDFTVTKGAPAYVKADYGNWQRYNEETEKWETITANGENRFSEGTWRFVASLRIDNTAFDGKDGTTHKFTDPLKVTVNENSWEVKYICVLQDSSQATITSPEYVAQHKVLFVPEKEATCTEKGIKAHYACGCGKWFEDGLHMKEITDHSSMEIPVTDHTWTKWSKGDATGHWHECENCAACDTVQAHIPGAEATETTPQTCTECGYIIKPVIGHIHNTTLVAAKEATCTAAGSKAYYICDGCEQWFEDAEATKEITDHSSILVEKKGHSTTFVDGFEATCTKNGEKPYYFCNNCGRRFEDEASTIEIPEDASVIIPAKGHKFKSEWNKGDEAGHYHECENCGACDTIQPHTPGAEATETTPQTCTLCGYIIVPALSHVHNTTLVAAKNATCKENGNKAYYICEGCETWFEDAEATKEIADHSSVILPMIGHIDTDKDGICDICGALVGGIVTPSITPGVTPSITPKGTPSAAPEGTPSVVPSSTPGVSPSSTPEGTPGVTPSSTPEGTPGISPSSTPEGTPGAVPSSTPEGTPGVVPSSTPEGTSGAVPSSTPGAAPSSTPGIVPSGTPGAVPSSTPGIAPSSMPGVAPSSTPGVAPSSTPEGTPIVTPESTPSKVPTKKATLMPTKIPTKVPAKGSQLKDSTGKAVYKVTKPGTTLEYVKLAEKNMTTVRIPATVTIDGITYKITGIAKNAFKNNKKITKVVMGSNITSIGSNAFYGCSKLRTVTIGKNVTSIGDKAFYKCISLTKVTIPSKVSKIGKSAFYGCKKLKSITIKTTKLTSKKVGSNALKGIDKKATVKVPKSKLKDYKKILKAKGIGKTVKVKK